jgi:predicted dehydrogenase
MATEHLKAFSSLEEVEIVGIYSRTAGRAEKLAKDFKIPFVSSSIKELFEQTKADLVVVTVFETAMLEVALECLKYAWQVFLEKPPGYNHEQAVKIQEAALHVGKKIMVGLNRRFLNSSLVVKQSLSSLNEKRFIQVCDQQSLDTARFYKHPEVVVKNWMYANSIHTLDYFTYFCRGELVKVTRLNEWEFEKTFVLLAYLQYSSGDEGLYQAIWSGPGPWSVMVQTPANRWELRPLEKVTHQKLGERIMNELPGSTWDSSYKPGFYLQAKAVVKYCKDNTAEEAVFLESALKTMELIKKIYKV